MLRHPSYTRGRIRQLVDLIESKVYADIVPLTGLEVAGPTDRIAYADAQSLAYEPLTLGRVFGPDWATFWVRGTARIPAEWKGRWVDLVWDTNSEGTLYLNGRTEQGLNTHSGGPRLDAVLARSAVGGETIPFVIEVACNQKFGIVTSGGTYAGRPMKFELLRADLAVRDDLAFQLAGDLRVLAELEAEHDKGLDPSWAGYLMEHLNKIANAFNIDDRNTWPAALTECHKLLQARNGTFTHEVSAIGHAHIDTAWLWPLAETRRKCERSFASAVSYMKDYPEYRFAVSQAYQYDLMRKVNPDLYRRMKEAVAAGQWIVVGGTWIEPDCNLPSGEALARQFVFGQRYFKKEFGRYCREFWNPDVFGYNGQLPQLMKLSGMTRFLTQKLSWNAFTKPMHHTFTWQGIDGSEVLAHFPPSDTYNSNCSVEQLRFSATNHKDHDRSRHSYYLFGWGDGGGGPTRLMLENLRRVGDLQGVPRTKQRTSDEFFELLERDTHDRPTIVGELYFELHRGTYTSQAATKRGNRRSEDLLHDVEFLSAVAAKTNGYAYPRDRINAVWEIVLLNQFHDILPGSSIGQVYVDAANHYAEVKRDGEALAAEAAAALPAGGGATFVNTCPVPRSEVVQTAAGLAAVSGPAYGTLSPVQTTPVVLKHDRDTFVLSNAFVTARVDSGGRVTSLSAGGPELLSAPANVLMMYEDRPKNWEAWDVEPHHLETAKACAPATSAKVLSDGPLRAEIEFTYQLTPTSTATQRVRLDATGRRLEFFTTVDWHESRKFLKAMFPTNVRAMHATYEMQFGCVERPTHFNTPADIAKFEVPLHKWFDLSQPGLGLSVLSESKYGGSTRGGTMFLSLLRAPNEPDPNADRGRHEFAYALLPHSGDWRTAGTVGEGYCFNRPPRQLPGGGAVVPPAVCDTPALVLDTIKLAEDDDALVLRFYESHGSADTATVRLAPALGATKAELVNLLEETIAPIAIEGDAIRLPFTPFQVLTLRVR